MTDTPQKFLKPDERPAKIIRYDGQLPNELKEKIEKDGIGGQNKAQAIFEVQGLGKVLCESSDGEHWKAIALMVEDKGDDEN
jgi:hypothetical protein